MKLNSSRDLFFEKVGQVIESEDIYIVAADLAGRPFDEIRKNYPQRYVPVGIAEQNMISVACGIALSGKKVIAYTSNPFISFHAFEQVRNGAALMDLPLVIAGVGVGFGISEYGPTHFITEDFAMMSLCPNMKIVTVSDDKIASMAFEEMLSRPTLTYLRFDKQCVGELCDVSAEDYKNGFRWVRRDGEELVLATGYMSHLLNERHGPCSLIDIFGWPFDAEALLDIIKTYDRVSVYEEQQSRGGIGSALLEIMNANDIHVPVGLYGVDYKRRFPGGVYGSREYWLHHYGLV